MLKEEGAVCLQFPPSTYSYLWRKINVNYMFIFSKDSVYSTVACALLYVHYICMHRCVYVSIYMHTEMFVCLNGAKYTL